MTSDAQKSLGQAIDEIVQALEAIEEKSRLTAVRAAADHIGLDLGGWSRAAVTTPPPGTAADPSLGMSNPASSGAPRDIRSLKEQKQPSNSFEMSCLVAYYLESLAPQAERKAEIATADLEKYFRQAEYPLPKKIGQVLIDAKAAGYFDSAARGTYKLNAVGHNLVVHKLPRVAGAAARPRGTAKPSRKGTGKAGKKGGRR